MENEQTQNDQPETSIDAQIREMKDAGITFEKCTEREAREYMADKCFPYKVSAYATLFDVHDKGENEGKYIDLDFYRIKYLADVDQRLREILLAASLDIEHFYKTKLVTECAVTEDGEYKVVQDYMASVDEDRTKYIEAEIKRHEESPYCQGIPERREGALPLSAFLEAVSFGTIIGVIRFCATQRDDKRMMADYYILRSIKTLRNACAHNSPILLNLHPHKGGKRIVSPEVRQALAATDIAKHPRDRWLQAVPTAQIASLLYLYNEIVPDGSTKDRRMDALHSFLESAQEDSVLPVANPARAALSFINQLTVSFHLVN